MVKLRSVGNRFNKWESELLAIRQALTHEEDSIKKMRMRGAIVYDEKSFRETLIECEYDPEYVNDAVVRASTNGAP